MHIHIYAYIYKYIQGRVNNYGAAPGGHAPPLPVVTVVWTHPQWGPEASLDSAQVKESVLLWMEVTKNAHGNL